MNNPPDDIARLFIGLHDINHIELPKKWFSLAFNRMLHESFAPNFVWDALIKYCLKWPDESECYIGAEDFFMSHDRREMDKVSLRLKPIIAYLLHNFRFTKDYVLISLSGNWAIRLDQDVTYFLFYLEDKNYIFDLFGGFDEVEEFMLKEFDGVKGRDGVVEKFVSVLLKNT
jgi:hypothetical protein